MDTLDQKYQKINQALKTLNIAIDNFGEINAMKSSPLPFTNYDEMRKTYRDSLIQRFEFSVDLFWKYLKKYLELIAKQPDINGPGPVIRASFAAGLLDEQNAETALEMIKARNLTSHVYIEKIAEKLSKQVPDFYVLMQSTVDRIKP